MLVEALLPGCPSQNEVRAVPGPAPCEGGSLDSLLWGPDASWVFSPRASLHLAPWCDQVPTAQGSRPLSGPLLFQQPFSAAGSSPTPTQVQSRAELAYRYAGFKKTGSTKRIHSQRQFWDPWCVS